MTYVKNMTAVSSSLLQKIRMLALLLQILALDQLEYVHLPWYL